MEHAYEDPDHTLLTVAIANSRNRPALQQTLLLLNMHGLELLRAQVVEVDLQAVLPLALGREGEAYAVVGHLRRTQKCCDDGAAWRGEEPGLRRCS